MKKLPNQVDYTNYFGYPICVEKITGTWASYPWRFKIKDESGRWVLYGGVPNYCETKASALKRAWWRAKWMSDGTIDFRYV